MTPKSEPVISSVSSNNSKGSLLVGGKSKKQRYTRGSHSRRIKTI